MFFDQFYRNTSASSAASWFTFLFPWQRWVFSPRLFCKLSFFPKLGPLVPKGCLMGYKSAGWSEDGHQLIVSIIVNEKREYIYIYNLLQTSFGMSTVSVNCKSVSNFVYFFIPRQMSISSNWYFFCQRYWIQHRARHQNDFWTCDGFSNIQKIILRKPNCSLHQRAIPCIYSELSPYRPPHMIWNFCVTIVRLFVSNIFCTINAIVCIKSCMIHKISSAFTLFA